MNRYLSRPWFPAALLSGLLALGCGHGRQCHCRCGDCCSGLSGHLTVMPVATPKPAESASSSSSTSKKEAVAQAEAQEPPATDAVSVAMAFPPSDGSEGSVTGTVILTAADAKAMGIRPGYTPGALWVPATTHELAAAPAHIEKPQEAAPAGEKPAEPPPAFLPVDQPK